MGGLGIRACAKHAEAAHVASCAAASHLVSVFTSLDIQPFDTSCVGYVAALGLSDMPDQHLLSRQIDSMSLTNLATELAASISPPSELQARAVTRLAAAGQPGTSLWLAPPIGSHDILGLSAASFRANVRLRLGLRLFDGAPPLCTTCRRAYVDPYGDHALLFSFEPKIGMILSLFSED